VGETFRCEMFGPRRQGVAHLLPESAHCEQPPLTFDQSVVEPGRARRRHLAVEIDVRPVGEHKGWPGIAGPAELAHLDDAAGGRRVGEGLDPRKCMW
jgi:hypothetical protein